MIHHLSRPMPGSLGGKPSYRAMFVTSIGAVVEVRDLIANSDIPALGIAAALAGGHAVELWDGLRFIERFEAKD